MACEQTRNAQPTYNVDWRSARQHTSSPTTKTSRLGFGSKPALKSWISRVVTATKNMKQIVLSKAKNRNKITSVKNRDAGHISELLKTTSAVWESRQKSCLVEGVTWDWPECTLIGKSREMRTFSSVVSKFKVSFRTVHKHMRVAAIWLEKFYTDHRALQWSAVTVCVPWQFFQSN